MAASSGYNTADVPVPSSSTDAVTAAEPEFTTKKDIVEERGWKIQKCEHSRRIAGPPHILKVPLNRLVAKPGCWEIGFRQISLTN